MGPTTICLNCITKTPVTLKEYAQNSLAGELTNTLFIAVIFSLITYDLRRFLPIEAFFKQVKVQNPLVKAFFFPFYWIILVTIGLIGLFFTITVLWALERIL
jgi:hypothetical protein